jgi:hypothetical protein
MNLHCCTTTLVAFALVGFLTLAVQGFAGEKKIARSDVPAAVVKAFEHAYPHAKVKGYAKETEHGKTYYEIETVEGSISRDLLYGEDGTIKEIEESATMASLPDAVAKAFSKEAPGSMPAKIEKVTNSGKVTYEFGMGKGKSEMVIDPSGKVVKQSTTVEKSKEKQEDKED